MSKRDDTRKLYRVTILREGMTIPCGRHGTLESTAVIPLLPQIRKAQRAGLVKVEPVGEGDPREALRETQKPAPKRRKRKQAPKAIPNDEAKAED